MPHIKPMIDIIIEEGQHSKMVKLNELFCKSLGALKMVDKPVYKLIEKELHLLSYGEHLSEHEALKWVSHMINEDGSSGAHWTMVQTDGINSHKFNRNDWYVVMNMMYSDYYCSSWSDSDYIHLATKYLLDKDGAKDKLIMTYYSHI